jgi:hypothetical protein
MILFLPALLTVRAKVERLAIMASRARRPDLRDVRPPSPRSLHDAGHVLHVAVAVIRIDEDGQARCVGDVAHRGAVLAVLREIDVGVGEVGAHEGEATDLVRGVLEAG